MGGVAVRQADADDASALAVLVVALNAELGWPECHFTSERFLRDGLGPDRWFDTIVAERDGELVGYAMFHRSYDTETARRGSYLTDLYVVPAERRGGIGRALLGTVAERTRGWGGEVVWWVTTRQNRTGRAFYRRLARDVPDVEVWVAEGRHFESLLAGPEAERRPVDEHPAEAG